MQSLAHLIFLLAVYVATTIFAVAAVALHSDALFVNRFGIAALCRCTPTRSSLGEIALASQATQHRSNGPRATRRPPYAGKLSSLTDYSTVDEVNISNLGHYRSEEDSDYEVNAHTPMIMDSEIRSPQRDGLGLQNKQAYAQLYYASLGVGVALILGVGFWLMRYIGGFGFNSPSQVFNYHPMLMVLGFVFLYGNAMLIYRTMRGELKPKLKLLHAALNGSVVVICSFGSLAVLYFHQKASIPHFYSLHSWLGISTWTLFLSQFTAGFVTFLFPGASYNIRTLVMPFHRFLGVATFVVAAATCLTGFNEKAIFALNGNNGAPKYADMTAAGVVVNFVALILVAYVSLVVYLVTKPEFKRNPLPEEQNPATTSPKHALSEVNVPREAP